MTTHLMPGETANTDPPVTGTWIRIVSRFDWTGPTGVTFHLERVKSGTCYKAETPMKVREVLETYMGKRVARLALHYGDTTTGEDWLDEFDMEGYIGVSMGPYKSPLLIANNRSHGGGSILDQCIIRIRFANRSIGGDLYRHPNYHADRDKNRSNIPNPAAEERVWNRRFA